MVVCSPATATSDSNWSFAAHLLFSGYGSVLRFAYTCYYTAVDKRTGKTGPGSTSRDPSQGVFIKRAKRFLCSSTNLWATLQGPLAGHRSRAWTRIPRPAHRVCLPAPIGRCCFALGPGLTLGRRGSSGGLDWANTCIVEADRQQPNVGVKHTQALSETNTHCSPTHQPRLKPLTHATPLRHARTSR